MAASSMSRTLQSWARRRWLPVCAGAAALILGGLTGCGAEFRGGGTGGVGGAGGGEQGGAAGAAPAELGEPCGDAVRCASGHCVDGVCCEAACDEACWFCAFEEQAGRCQPAGLATDPRGACTPAGTCDGTGVCALGAVVWSSAYGGTGADYPRDVATDSQFNVISTGRYAGAVSFGGAALPQTGSQEIFAVKLSPAGQHVWSRGFGSVGEDHGAAVAVDASDQVILAGGFRGVIDFGGDPLTSTAATTLDVYLAKLDDAGEHLWSHRFGGAADQEATDVAVLGTDRVTVVGNYHGSIDFGGGPLPASVPAAGFVAAFTGDGAPLWSHAHQGSANSFVRAVAIEPSGTTWLAGDFAGSLNINGTLHHAAGAQNTYLVALSPEGSYLRTVPWDGDGQERIYDLAVDGQGNVVVTGFFDSTLELGGAEYQSAGEQDGFVAKLDGTGTVLWSRSFGAAGNDYGTGVALDGVGNVVVSGTFATSVDFGGGQHEGAGEADMFVVKLAPDGTHLWTQTYGGPGDQHGNRVIVDGQSHVILAGLFFDSFELGSTDTSAGDYDVVFAKISP